MKELFRMYSAPWKDIARMHMNSVVDQIKQFLELLLRHLLDTETAQKVNHNVIRHTIDEYGQYRPWKAG